MINMDVCTGTRDYTKNQLHTSILTQALISPTFQSILTYFIPNIISFQVLWISSSKGTITTPVGASQIMIFSDSFMSLTNGNWSSINGSRQNLIATWPISTTYFTNTSQPIFPCTRRGTNELKLRITTDNGDLIFSPGESITIAITITSEVTPCVSRPL